MPYYIAGVAVAIGFKMSLFNIGVDGQYLLAALFAAGWAGADGRACRRRSTCCSSSLVAVVVGGAWAAIAGILKVTRNVNEVISTIMLNYIATGLRPYLLRQLLRPRRSLNVAETGLLPEVGPHPVAQLAVRGRRLPLARGVVLQGFLPFADRRRDRLLRRCSTAAGSASTCGCRAPTRAPPVPSGVNPKRMVLITIMHVGRASPG